MYRPPLACSLTESFFYFLLQLQIKRSLSSLKTRVIERRLIAPTHYVKIVKEVDADSMIKGDVLGKVLSEADNLVLTSSLICSTIICPNTLLISLQAFKKSYFLLFIGDTTLHTDRHDLL